MTARWRTAVLIIACVLLAGGGAAYSQLPALGAGGLLHPARRPYLGPAPPSCRETTFAGAGISLQGWRCGAEADRRATLVYLHGIADNRMSAAGAVARYRQQGFDVVAFDSRAHGASEGSACTYGFYEKDDLARVLDTLAPGPIVLLGTSLGAAVALQEAADDARVTAVVAVEPFSDLRTVATERAPFFFTAWTIERALALAERDGAFQVDAVSPAAAATRIRQPVLLVHGATDTETPPGHSQRILNALAGPKRLILVPGAGHNQSLNPDIWKEVDRWIEMVLR